jgi:hypothetical protein
VTSRRAQARARQPARTAGRVAARSLTGYSCAIAMPRDRSKELLIKPTWERSTFDGCDISDRLVTVRTVMVDDPSSVMARMRPKSCGCRPTSGPR